MNTWLDITQEGKKMDNKQPTIINRPKKAFHSVNTATFQNGTKKVTKVKQRSCCMGGRTK